MQSNVNIEIQEQRDSEQLAVDCNKRKALIDILNSDDYDPNNPEKLLGVDWCDRKQTKIRAKYYIGLKWVKEKECFLYVRPKINNLDFMTMFMHCFDNDCRDVSSKLGRIYSIDFNAAPIKIDTAQSILTPMLVVHFLKLTEQIVKKGFKFNYIQREENLACKIKGKVLLNQTLKRNYSTARSDRTICRYQNYSIDCIENRILKKTLKFINKFINVYNDISCSVDLKNMTTYCLGTMSAINDDLPLQTIKQFKINPLYKEYREALKVAQLILKRFSYDIEQIDKESEKSLPPFWIDMSLLFELYVYSKLKSAYKNLIYHHVSTYGNEIDFVKYDEKVIIDAKYIPIWEEEVNHNNVRQLSGYARNTALRKKITKIDNDESTIINCLIIYPHKVGEDEFSEEILIKKAEKIDTYIKFYKLRIKLPTKSNAKQSDKDSN